MENDLSRVVDALPGLVWIALPDGRTEFVNRRWAEYTGFTLEEASGHGWHDALHPEDRAGLLAFWGSLVASGEPGEMEARMRRFDGVYRWFHFRASPFTDESGHVVKWCGVNTDVEDRKRAEEALREHERRFGLIVDGLPAVVTLMTPEGVVDYANRHLLEYLGTTLDLLRGRTLYDWFHPDDRQEVIEGCTKSVQTGTPYDHEGRLRRADGVYRWFHTRGFPLRDADGRIVAWYLLQTDVDYRKRAETLLAGEKQLLEMIASGSSLPVVFDAMSQLVEATVDGSRCSILLIDPDDGTVQIGAARGLPDAYREAVVGKPVHQDAGPCGEAATAKRLVIVQDVESDTRWETHGWRSLALANGLRSCWSSPILSGAQNVLGTLAIYGVEPGAPTQFELNLIEQLSHIASVAIEHTRNDEALRQNEAFLIEAQRLSSTGGFRWNLTDDTLTWSDEVYRIFELDPSETPSGELMLTRVHPDDAEIFEETRLKLLREAVDFIYDYRLLMPNGSIKYLHVVAHATTDREGRPVFNAACQDITHRRLSEEAVSKARAELARVARITSLGALTASIAHEVSQPLAGIVMNASTCLRMLASDPPNLDGARETARRTIRDGHRASDVITRLRALFSNKEATTESVDLNEAAREVIALSASELDRNRVALRVELGNVPAVAGDRVQLQQVILNLLLNACDAMSEIDDRPRQLVIRTECDDDDHVRLNVRDAGVGIDPQGAERLFEAFYTTKRGGMGIGLSVSRSIIESHQGRLWAMPNDGPGATFAFSIPRGPDGSTGAEHAQGSS